MIKDILAANDAVKPNKKETEILKRYFPQCFNKEGKFDITEFQSLIKDDVSIVREGYDLNFLGKSYAKYIASTDTTTVIKPDVEHNSKPENAKSNNIYISGDNLDGLKHILKSYASKVKCIYIDPPYNTGTDGFIYNDNFNFTVDDLAERLSVSEDEASKILDLTRRGSASHSAWLMFMAPRLQLARDLLADDGAIFISIDDNEQANLKLLCDNIFGEENFAGCFPWRKRTAKSDVPFGISQDFEWILCYCRTEDFFASVDGKGRKYYETPDFRGREWRIHDLTKQTSAAERPNSDFTIVNPKNGESYPANPKRTWAITKETFDSYYNENRIIFPGDYGFLNISRPVLRYWKEDDMKKAGDKFGKISVSTLLPPTVGMSQDGTKDLDKLFQAKVFSYPKPVSLVKHLLQISVDDNTPQLVVDFFSGSATTAQAVMEINSSAENKNLQYILVQLPEKCGEKTDAYKAGFRTIDEIGQERIKRAAKQIKADTGAEIDYGFRHYTLVEPSFTTVDKLENFDPHFLITDDNILNDFGKDAVLATWLVSDGYGFGAKLEKLKLDEYIAYYIDNHLYLIDPYFDEDDMVALVDKYNHEPAFNPENVVLFGYSFTFTETEMIKKNLATMKDTAKNKKNIHIRY